MLTRGLAPGTAGRRSGGRPSPNKRAWRAVRRLLAAWAALLPVGIGPGIAQAAPPTPVFSKQLGDCVTGDNQFFEATNGKYRWYINQSDTANGSAQDGITCDSYPNDQYERPTN